MTDSRGLDAYYKGLAAERETNAATQRTPPIAGVYLGAESMRAELIRQGLMTADAPVADAPLQPQAAMKVRRPTRDDVRRSMERELERKGLKPKKKQR